MSERQFAASSYNRLTADWPSYSTSADAEVRTSIRMMRNRARQLERDDSVVKSAIRGLTMKIIGDAIGMKATVRTKGGFMNSVNERIEFLWCDFCDYCHTAGLMDFNQLIELLVKTWIRDGEVFVKIHRSSFGAIVPLALEVIESDQCPEWMDGTRKGTYLRMGIEVDDYLRPVRYYFLPYHPGDSSFNLEQYANQKAQKVSARNVLHLIQRDRPNQTRGYSFLHTVMLNMRNLFAYTEAEIMKARGQANIMAAVTTNDADFTEDNDVNNYFNADADETLEPAVIKRLAPGESFVGFDPSSPNPAYGDFVGSVLQQTSAGVGLPYSHLTFDTSNSNFSRSKADNYANKDYYLRLRKTLKFLVLSPIYKEFITQAVLGGALKVKDFYSQPGKYYSNEWQFATTPSFEPHKDTQTSITKIQNGLSTVTDELALMGKDIRDVVDTRLKELTILQKVKDKERELSNDVPPGDGDSNDSPSDSPPSTGGIAEGLTPVPERQAPIQLEINLNKEKEVTKIVYPGLALTGDTEKERAPKCTKGFRCGASCQSRKNICRKNLTALQKTQLDQLKKTIKKQSGGASAEQTELLEGLKVASQPAVEAEPEIEPVPSVEMKGYDPTAVTEDMVPQIKQLLKDVESGKTTLSEFFKKPPEDELEAKAEEYLEKLNKEGFYEGKKFLDKPPQSAGLTPEKKPETEPDREEFEEGGTVVFGGIITEHNRNLKSVADGQGDLRTEDQYIDGFTSMASVNTNDYQKPKVAKLMAEGLTTEEALAVATWVDSKYQPINAAIYNPSANNFFEKDYGEASGIGMVKGLKKLPKATKERIEALAEKNFQKANTSKYKRTIEVNDPDSFLAPFERALSEGKTYIEPSAFATTTRTNLKFFDGNVELRVKPNYDNPKGVLVDKYKNNAYEGEVLYAPMSRFKVVSIDKSGYNPQKVPKKFISKVGPEEKQAALNEWSSAIKAKTYVAMHEYNAKKVLKKDGTIKKSASKGYVQDYQEGLDFINKNGGTTDAFWKDTPKGKPYTEKELNKLKVDSGVAEEKWKEAQSFNASISAKIVVELEEI